MSSEAAAPRTCSSALAASAPACEDTMMLSRKIISVGIERIRKCSASSCCSSVFTLANRMSGCRTAAAAKTGAKARQGPHHGAQKSITANAWPSIDSAKFSFVSSRTAVVSVAMACLCIAVTSDQAEAAAPPASLPSRRSRLPTPEQKRKDAVLLGVLQELVPGLLGESLEIPQRGGIGR